MAFSPLTQFQSTFARVAEVLDDDAIPWMTLIQILLVVVLSFEVLVSLLQLRTYNEPAPPATLKPHVTQETYEKSRIYGRDKLQFSIFSLIYEWALSAALLHAFAYARIWSAAGLLMTKLGYTNDSEVIHSLFFLLLSQPVTSIPLLPLSLYKNFVIEERHGFNKMTLKTFFLDGVKGWAVGVIVAGPFMAGLIKLIRWAGDSFVAYVVVFLFVFQLVAMTLYPTLIQPLFNKLTPLEDGPLKDRVVALATQLNFPLKSIYVIDGSKRSAHSNAYFYGVLPGGSKHIVIYDTLIEKSTPAEIEAVLAHELGHWAHSDTSKLMGLSQVQISFTMSLFTLFIHNASLFRAFGLRYAPLTSTIKSALLPLSSQVKTPFAAPLNSFSVSVGYLPIVVGLELFQLVLHPLDSLIKFSINAAIRRMEYAADRFAAQQPRAPELIGGSVKHKSEDVELNEPYTTLLGKALIKLHIQNLSTMHHDALYSAYHYSHPTLTERLDELEKIKAKTK
ncbi:hypothetical protein L7F22_003120 [Adiantum nelumboides]|nr:hypothetical protein [Adiantum nelumboides]